MIHAKSKFFYFSGILLMFNLLYSCSTKEIKIANKYDNNSFEIDFKSLLSTNQIDSSTYYRGIILQDYANKNKQWDNLSYFEIQDWINRKIRWKGFINFQEHKDEFLNLNLKKEYIDTNQIEFKLEIDFNDLSQIREHDTIRLWIVHLNLMGYVAFGTELNQVITKDVKLNNEINHKYVEDSARGYIKELPLICNKIDEIPIEQYGKLSRFKITKYFHIRSDSIKSEIQIE